VARVLQYAVPGGIQLSWFTRVWGSINDMLDSNNMQRILSLPDWTKKILRISVTPVDSSAEGLRVLDAAVDAHRDNWDVHAAASRVFAHGDIPSSIPRGIAEVSPFAHFNGLAAAAKKGMAVLGASGWLDGANANAAIKRFRALKALGVPDEHNIMFLGGFQVRSWPKAGLFVLFVCLVVCVCVWVGWWRVPCTDVRGSLFPLVCSTLARTA